VRLRKWLVDRNITPHVPVRDKSECHDGTFSRSDFVFNQERNVYVCPGGTELTSTGNIDQSDIVYYRARKSDCSQCSLKPTCTTAIVRKITCDLSEDMCDQPAVFAWPDAKRLHQNMSAADNFWSIAAQTTTYRAAPMNSAPPGKE
jgi:hypothetical protein